MIGRTNTGGGGVGGVLTVTAPAGVTVEVSKDGKIKRKTANAEGLAVFKGLESGTWTLTITDGNQTATQTVKITADYSAVIAFFAATINITYPSGSTCTCTDGTTTLKAPNTGGTWACVVPNTGKWTVICTDGTKSKSAVVTINTDGQSASIKLAYETVVLDASTLTTDTAKAMFSGVGVHTTVTKDGNYIVLRNGKNSGTEGYYYDFCINTPYDFTDVSELVVEGYGSKENGCKFGVRSTTSSTNSAEQTFSTSNKKLTLKVNTLRGKNYISFTVCFNGGKVYLKSVKLV